MNHTTTAIAAAFATTTFTSAASAATADQPMFQAANPATFGTQIAFLDVASTSYQFDSGSFSSSGFVNEPFPNAPFNSDITSLTTTVFQINQAVSLSNTTSGGPGTLNLNAGDLVFEYTIRLTSAGQLTVDALTEFQANALGNSPAGNGPGFFTNDIILGRGFSTDGLANPSQSVALDAIESDLQVTDLGFLQGSSQSWEWEPSQGLANGEEIRLLLFADSSSLVVEGRGFLGGEASTNAGVNPQANEIPILVPAVPGVGTAALSCVALLSSARRRR